MRQPFQPRRPGPPPVDEVLAEAEQQLRNLPPREAKAERRNALRQAQEAAEATAAARVHAMPDVVDFDAENGADGEKAQDHTRHVKIEFDQNDVRFWFSQLEAEMEGNWKILN